MRKLSFLFKYFLVYFFLKKKINKEILEDIEKNILERCPKHVNKPLFFKFKHLMFYYPDFSFLFFWRTNNLNRFYKSVFKISNYYQSKIFRSTILLGGVVPYHSFSTIINAKKIGTNFIYRNNITIGNKNNNNDLCPIIGNNVEVGANAVLLGDITIGNNVVIGAGAVVVKNIPNDVIVVGNPARILKKRT